MTQHKIELDAIRRNLADIDAVFTAGKITVSRLEELRGPLAANAKNLTTRIENAYASLATDSVLRSWGSLTNDEKRIIIRKQVEHIWVYHDCVVTTRAGIDQETIYPLVRKHIDGYKSQRPFNCLIPHNPRIAGWKTGDRDNGRPYKMVEWQSASATDTTT